MTTCGVCSARAIAKGLCDMHYRRDKKYGDPLAGPPLRPKNGQVRSTFERLMHDDGTGCLIWPHGRDKNGYGVIDVNGRQWRVHVLAHQQRHGDPPFTGALVLHNCGNRACFRDQHLRWGTDLENQRDRIADATSPSGVRNGRAKLSEADVLAIRSAASFDPAVSRVALAAQYGVTPSVVSHIITRRTWSHLP